MARWFCLVVVTFSLSACAWSNEGILEDFRQNALPRAAFQMSCPSSQVETVILRNASNANNASAWNSSVGVTGCGQRLVYRHAGPQGWVMDSGGEANPRSPASQ